MLPGSPSVRDQILDLVLAFLYFLSCFLGGFLSRDDLFDCLTGCLASLGCCLDFFLSRFHCFIVISLRSLNTLGTHFGVLEFLSFLVSFIDNVVTCAISYRLWIISLSPSGVANDSDRPSLQLTCNICKNDIGLG